MVQFTEKKLWDNYFQEKLGTVALGIQAEHMGGLAAKVLGNIQVMRQDNDNLLRIRNLKDQIPHNDPVYQKLQQAYVQHPCTEIAVAIFCKATKLHWRIMTEPEYNHLYEAPMDILISELYKIGKEELAQ